MNTLINKLPNDSSEQLLPWYRYGWPWFLISLPSISVVLGCVMLYLALHTNNSLVVDDYYKQGKAINIRIERDRAATLLGVGITLSQTSEGLVVQTEQALPELPEQLMVDAKIMQGEFNWPDTLDLRWVHITQAERDGSATLVSIGGNRYIAQGVSLPDDGKYRLHVQPEGEADWRLISELQNIGGGIQVRIAAQSPEQLFNSSQLR